MMLIRKYESNYRIKNPEIQPHIKAALTKLCAEQIDEKEYRFRKATTYADRMKVYVEFLKLPISKYLLAPFTVDANVYFKILPPKIFSLGKEFCKFCDCLFSIYKGNHSR